MKKIYVLITPAYHESEEMVFTYAVYDKDEQLVEKKSIYHEYRKPLLAGLFGISAILKELKPYRSEDVIIVVNDGALIEQINGTTTTKNTDVLKIAKTTRKSINNFSDTISFVSVAGNHTEKLNWESKLSV